MFNPSQLKVIRQGVDSKNYDGFVGIRRKKGEKLEFCLPYGFENFEIDNPADITKLFFSLYRTFGKYQTSFENDDEQKQRYELDGTIQSTGKFTFISKDDEQVTLYSKILNIETILKNYDEIRIFSIVTRPRRTDRIDYAQVTKYLHQAVFLKNNIAYIDEMVLPQPTLELTITDLVRMYCYVLWEIKKQLEEEAELTSEIVEQAKVFHELNLQPDSALFSLNHESTINLLKSTLDNIHQQISLKDDDYWHFFTALEKFLYGIPTASDDSGILWGITNFAYVWEDMCMFYMFHNEWDGVWYADSPRFSNTKIGRFRVFLDSEYTSPFYFRLNKKYRHLRPDLVRKIKPFDEKEWFEENFKVEWLGEYSCRITLLNKNFISWFDYGLDTKLKKKSPGMRQKKQGTTSHTYNPITKKNVEAAISELRPEIKKKFATPAYHIIVDFKHVDLSSYSEQILSEKIKNDIIKQLTYEYAVISNAPGNIEKVKSQFCIPYLFQSDHSNSYESVASILLHDEIREQNIFVVKMNFKVVQDLYISRNKI